MKLGWAVAERRVETHLHKHLGPASPGPAGGAQGNKQLWLENLTVILGLRGDKRVTVIPAILSSLDLPDAS